MVKLMIDSASDISKSEADKLGVLFVPIEVRFDDEEFLDGVNLLPEAFYDKLIESTELPKTSQINPFRYEEAFAEATKNGDEIVVITLSSKLSGTYKSALEAAKKFKDKVFVVDSLNACVGERLLCLYGLELLKQNLSASEIKKQLDEIKSKITVIAMVNTLKYLKKGGRISAVAAVAGEMFSIKPVVGVVNGEVKVLGKAMGSKKANNMLNTIVEQKGGIDFTKPVGVIYSGNDKTMLNKYVEDSSHLWKDFVKEVPAYIIGSTIGTHVGPGAVGVAFFEK